MTSARDAIASRVAADTSTLLELSRRIHANPEVAWEEHQAAAWVGATMDDATQSADAALLDAAVALALTVVDVAADDGVSSRLTSVDGPS